MWYNQSVRVSILPNGPKDKSLGFDTHQFEDRNKYTKEVVRKMDKSELSDLWVITKPMVTHTKPEWMATREGLEGGIAYRLKHGGIPPRKRHKLKLKWLKIIHLYYVMGYFQRDIAEELGVSVGCVRRIIQRLSRPVKLGGT